MLSTSATNLSCLETRLMLFDLNRTLIWVYSLVLKWIIKVLCILSVVNCSLNGLTFKHSEFISPVCAGSVGNFWKQTHNTGWKYHVSLFMSINNSFIFMCQTLISYAERSDTNFTSFSLSGLIYSTQFNKWTTLHSLTIHSLFIDSYVHSDFVVKR